MIIILYVDGMLLTSNNEGKMANFNAELRATFDMSDMRMLHFYLGIQFIQNKHGIVMSQSKYVQKLLEQFKMKDCKPISTPTEPG